MECIHVPLRERQRDLLPWAQGHKGSRELTQDGKGKPILKCGENILQDSRKTNYNAKGHRELLHIE